MKADALLPEMTKLVTPRAIRNYAAALGWLQVLGINGSISVYHRPDSDLHQLIVPLDESFDDYGESVAEAIRKLAAFEHRPPIEVLNHILLPPSDVFRFSETGPGTEAGTLPFQQAVDFLDGTRIMLLSTAHSTLRPQAYHARLSRGSTAVRQKMPARPDRERKLHIHSCMSFGIHEWNSVRPGALWPSGDPRPD